MQYLVYYQKANGDIIERKRKTIPDYNVGQTTSMGWIVKDIKYVGDKKIYNSYYELYANLKKRATFKNRIRKLKSLFDIKKIDISGYGWIVVILLFFVK